MRDRLLVEQVDHVQLETELLVAHRFELVGDEQVRPRQHGRPAHVSTSIHEDRDLVRAVDVGAHRRPAADVFEEPELSSEREVIRAVEFADDRPIRGQTSDDVQVAVRIVLELVQVPSASSRGARPGYAPGLLLRGRHADASRGRRDLVGVRQTGVVAIQTAPRVVDVRRPPIRHRRMRLSCVRYSRTSNRTWRNPISTSPSCRMAST